MAATTTKTIEYMLPMLSTGSAAGTAEGTSFTDSADVIIYIPETTSRAFVSVTLEMFCHDNNGTVTANFSGFGLRGSCDSGTNFTAQTSAISYNQSGENMCHVFVVDMTQEFQARFGSGSSGTFRYGYYMDYSAATQNIGNVSAKLFITYEFDHTAHSIRAKTVRIPIESFNGRLSISSSAIKQTNTSACQIPALQAVSNPFLPEASVTIRQAYLELWTNTLPSTTTDSNFIMKIDPGGSETTFGLVQGTNSTPLNVRFMYDVTTLDWTQRHEVFARHNVSGQSYYAHVGGMLVVNYEYNASTSGSILNSLRFGALEESGNIMTSASSSGFIVDKIITDASPISLVQSGIFMAFSTSTTSGTFSFSAGSQTITNYTPTAATGQAGMIYFMQRIDSGANAGSAISSLVRGRNYLVTSWYGNTVNIMGNVSGYFLLNYTSGVTSIDPDFYTQSRHYLIQPHVSTFGGTNVFTSTCRVPNIIPENYYIMGLMPTLYIAGYQAGTTGAVAQVLASGSGWRTLFNTVAIAPNEREPLINFGTSGGNFKRYPNDPDKSLIDVEQQLAWRVGLISTAYPALTIYVTYNNYSFPIAGSITSYSGTGSGVRVDFYDDAGAYSGSALTGASGSYVGYNYNDSVNMFARAEQDSTHVGSSLSGKAG